MLKEFRDFAVRGSVIDLAIAVIIGAAFGKIVTSLVNDVVMPPVGLLLGNVDFSNFFITLSGSKAATLAEAKDLGAVTINYGVFFSTVIDFIIVAFIIFMLLRPINRMKKKPAEAAVEPTTKECPFCISTVPVKAIRCPFCTSELSS
jgi:large conductance mechanosensitive channel